MQIITPNPSREKKYKTALGCEGGDWGCSEHLVFQTLYVQRFCFFNKELTKVLVVLNI